MIQNHDEVLIFCNDYWQEQTAKPRGIVKFEPATRVLDTTRYQRCVRVILDCNTKTPRIMILSPELFDSISQ